MSVDKEKRIDALRAKKVRIEAELTRLQARARMDARKADTRRKILIGAVIMQEMDSRPEFNSLVTAMLDKRLKKPRDRALFKLPEGTPPAAAR